MALAPGTRLGVYEVTMPIGEGGMGQVYRARDTKLDRDVAIKILPEAFAADVDRLTRFQREARTLASLNHPHIAAIYGLEESANITALVMELVGGEDLSQRIARGAIPIDEALPIAKQIAEALEAAHEQGIIHRDLKPANIRVRPDGTVKVLDFGLAKAMEQGEAGRLDRAQSPTITTPAMTQAGTILGTAAYMSPEQAKGQVVDRRADVWAFGVVLFEMLTGTRAFEGDGVSETLARVIERHPDWSRLPATLSPALRTYLERCLQKDPRQRIRDIGDVRLALDGAFEATIPQTTASHALSTPRGRLAWIASLGAAMIAGAAAVVIVALTIPALRRLREVPAPEPPVMRFTMALPDGVTLRSAPMISPDGTRVVFAGGGALFVRSLDALVARRLPATEDAASPFWSPDSRSVGFFAGGKLKRIDIAGGPAVTICDAQGAMGGTWSRADVMVFAPGGALQQVSAAGGTPAAVTVLNPDRQETSHRWPQFLPDGQHLVYLSLATRGNGVYVTSLGSRTSSALVSTDVRAEYTASGALLYMRGNTLMRQPFDAAGLRFTGDAAPVAEDVAVSTAGTSNASFSLSHTGVLVYATRPAAASHRLVWVDRRGGVTPLALAPGAYDNPALSPDGQHIVLPVEDATGSHLWVYDVARGTFAKRTFEGANDGFPVWTRDGTFLVFSRGLPTGSLMRVRADGTGNVEPLITDVQLPGMKIAGPQSADGRLLAIQSGTDVIVRDTDGALHSALTTGAWESEARFAPVGRWLAYTSDETGRPEVYVQSYPAGGGKWQISTEGGSQSMWAPNGRELFYRIGNRMMVVNVELGAAFKPGTPRVLFEMPLSESNPGDPARYGVTPDAQRFLVLTPAKDVKTTAAVPPLTVVLNSPQTLKR